ncbi:PREDICTED: uncharacterized protein LOC109114304, partial [Nelumbo nucifera]|uniref:Uncharacterized protein LOC109114304 n=1 Tax=Nelumbo nucifera TaxID=4432 RepID=A0A1U8Q080_NELNU
MEAVKDLRDDIKERFPMGNGPRIQQLKADLATSKQAGLPIVAYNGKLKQIWEELANYEQIPTCVYAGCNCNIAPKLEKRREEERVHQFLMGLDDSVYGTVCSNILGTDPLPNLNKAYAMVIQEERLKTMTPSKEERKEAMSFAVQPQSGTKRTGHDTKEKSGVCTNCERTGHEAESCFQLIVYPDCTTEKLTGMNWIIDTGVSHHMTGNLNLLRNTETVTGCQVGLPDGKHVMAIKKEIVILNEHMKLIDDCTSRMVIGAGELRGGLYCFKGARSSKVHKAKVEASYELWHKRMGHPSEKVIKLLPDLNIRCDSRNRICGVCSKAKQTR